ncbi:MAG: DUF1566 domain-containing protein [Gammaproteobacteria bacterium]|nr:MAG: DUF1566 domain-containing protein [Gammaproteobacteria bacterium]
MNMRTGILTGAALSLLLASAAQAALVSRLGGQAVYDTDFNITWLADANLATSNTFGVSGINDGGHMSWTTANEWIAAMNTANYLGYSDWRLPTTPQPDPSCRTQSIGGSLGYNCTGSEMGHLFYGELGGVEYQSISMTHNDNLDLFSIIVPAPYWSGTSYAPISAQAWRFSFGDGLQATSLKYYAYAIHAWAVRDGDVGVIPIPGAVWLLGSALGVLGIARRRGRRGG